MEWTNLKISIDKGLPIKVTLGFDCYHVPDSLKEPRDITHFKGDVIRYNVISNKR